MIQAHGMIAKVNEDETLAKQVYKLAREINVAIPAFSTTAVQAAEHALATSLLQEFEDSVEGADLPKKKNPFGAKKKTTGTGSKLELTQEAKNALYLSDELVKAAGQLENKTKIQFVNKDSSEPLAKAPSDEKLLQLQKMGNDIEESMKSFDEDDAKLGVELDKFQLKAESDTEKSLAEAEKVA